jgi:hypothetical protein
MYWANETLNFDKSRKGSLRSSSCPSVSYSRRLLIVGSAASQDSIAENGKRVAEVWLGDYTRLFYLYKPHMQASHRGVIFGG